MSVCGKVNFTLVYMFNNEHLIKKKKMGKNKKKNNERNHTFSPCCVFICATLDKSKELSKQQPFRVIFPRDVSLYFFFFSFSVLLFIRFATNGRFTLLSTTTTTNITTTTTTTTTIIIISTLHLALPAVVRYILHRLDRMAPKLYLVGTRVHLILDTTTILRLYDREPGIRVKNFNTEWPCIAARIGTCVL